MFITKLLIEVVFIVDSSASMLLKDTGWARIDLAVREINKLLVTEILKEGDRASCFILGLTGVIGVPLTKDLNTFALEISKLGRPKTLEGNNIYWGSNAGSALTVLYTSLDRWDMFAEFKGEEPKDWQPKIRRNRLAIIFTDGDFGTGCFLR